jgi:hypothetical protein
MTKKKDEGSAGLQNAWTTGHAAIAAGMNPAGVDAIVASRAARVWKDVADTPTRAASRIRRHVAGVLRK